MSGADAAEVGGEQGVPERGGALRVEVARRSSGVGVAPEGGGERAHVFSVVRSREGPRPTHTLHPRITHARPTRSTHARPTLDPHAPPARSTHKLHARGGVWEARACSPAMITAGMSCRTNSALVTSAGGEPLRSATCSSSEVVNL